VCFLGGVKDLYTDKSPLTGVLMYFTKIVNMTIIHGDVSAHVFAECLRLAGLCVDSWIGNEIEGGGTQSPTAIVVLVLSERSPDAGWAV
jgi:hypothetical protein